MSSTASALIARMREREADLADTTGTLKRRTGQGAFDRATATYAAPTLETVFTGEVLVRPDGEAVVDAGDTPVNVSAFVIKFPADTDVQIGDLFTVTASEHDAGLVGQALRVIDTTNDEWQVVRRARAVVETAMPT